LEHDIFARETGGLECLTSEIEKVSAKIENPHADFGSKENFIEGVHQGNLAHTKVNLLQLHLINLNDQA